MIGAVFIVCRGFCDNRRRNINAQFMRIKRLANQHTFTSLIVPIELF